MEYLSNVLISCIMFGTLAASLNLLFGFAGVFSMAHAAFFGIGAYATALLSIAGVNPFLAMIVGAVFAAGIGAAIALPSLRVKGDFTVLLTLGFQMIIYGVMISSGMTHGNSGLLGIPRPPNVLGLHFEQAHSFLPLAVLLIVICLAIMFRITRSPFGRVLKAMREDDVAVVAAGKNITKFKVLTFMISSAIAALVGGFYASYMTFISPSSFTIDVSIFVIATVNVGGLSNLWGSIVGAFLLTFVPEGLRFIGGDTGFINEMRQAIYGALLIIFMLFRPQGLIPEYMRIGRRGNNQPAGLSDTGTMKKREKPADSSLFDSTASARIDAGGNYLRAERITKGFGGITAVNDITFQMEKGKITGLIGTNGAGKTTIFNLLTGFINPDSGKIVYANHDIHAYPAYKVAQSGICRCFQQVRVFEGMTVLANVMVSRQKQAGEVLWRLFFTPRKVAAEEAENRHAALSYLDLVGLREKADTMTRDLSFAEKKMLQIASLLATESDVLLLDEPTAGVDVSWIERIVALIRRLKTWGKTICVIEHNLDVIRELSEFIYFLDQGKIVAHGTPQEIMSNEELGRKYFGL